MQMNKHTGKKDSCRAHQVIAHNALKIHLSVSFSFDIVFGYELINITCKSVLPFHFIRVTAHSTDNFMIKPFTFGA